MMCTVLPRCYTLLAVTPPPPPPPYFQAKLLYRVILPPFAVCGIAVLAHVRVLQVYSCVSSV